MPIQDLCSIAIAIAIIVIRFLCQMGIFINKNFPSGGVFMYAYI